MTPLSCPVCCVLTLWPPFLSVSLLQAGWVAGVAWHPSPASHLVAAAYHDGSVLLWDARSPAAPLHTLPPHARPAPAPAASAGKISTARSKTAPSSSASSEPAAADSSDNNNNNKTMALAVAWAGVGAGVGVSFATGATTAAESAGVIISGGSDNCIRCSLLPT
jgi:WD40 repeat protein